MFIHPVKHIDTHSFATHTQTALCPFNFRFPVVSAVLLAQSGLLMSLQVTVGVSPADTS